MSFVETLEPRTLLATVPAGFVETTIATGLSAPTTMAFAPDGRLFVCQQGGDLAVIKNGALLPAPFVSLRVNSDGERGLLGVTFDPGFASNHYVYVYYTVPGRHGVAPHNRVSRFTANGDLAARHSETVLLDLTDLSSASNHNGGAIHFGPDGKLYIAAGENNDGANAQDITNLLGKILRINPDGTIPADNPFARARGVNRAIWAIGLRNPYSFAFQAGTGRMFINDVGEHTYEEIDDGVAGSNYGWPATEGPTHRTRYRAPIYSYTHGDGPDTGDAIVGSAFYNPAAGRSFPRSYAGDYFFADLTSGWIRRLDPATLDTAGFASGIDTPVALAVNDADGSLYYLARGQGGDTGVVARIQYGAGGTRRALAPAAPPSAPAVFSRQWIADPSALRHLFDQA
ncbi:MAG TPA: PQQ-dependent sugar dehydrogenase [Tepidisphaeraceae bacterium]|jgi:glucose/arabinose dehydrogenase